MNSPLSATVDMAGRRQQSEAFSGRVIGVAIGTALIGFITYWILSTFSPQMSSGQDGGAHALSRSATGYSAIVELLRADRANVVVDRGEAGAEGLLVLTPTEGMVPASIEEAIEAHPAGNILVVLPRWRTTSDPQRRGWVRRVFRAEVASMVRAAPFNLADASFSQTASVGTDPLFAGRNQLRTLRSSGLDALIPAGDGTAVVGVVRNNRRIMILADADLISNHGVARPQQAVAAVRLMREIAGDEPILFNVSLNGFGAGRSVLRLAFTPPFLGLTLCLLFGGLFALWSGFGRFGPPWLDHRAIAFGKRGLVDSTARLIVQAQRLRGVAQDYTTMVRDGTARRLHAPHGLDDAALDAWLDRRSPPGTPPFSRLAAALRRARSVPEMVDGARALGQWRKEVLRERD